MRQKQSGDNWHVAVDGSVMVWEFQPGMALSAFSEEAYPVYEGLLGRYDVTAMVTDIQLEDPFDDEAFTMWERAAEHAAAAGVDRWAIVAEGIKSISLRGKVEVGDLETLATEDRAEAMEWARGADD